MDGCENHAGRADAALRAARFDHRLLYGVQSLAAGDALHGLNLCALDLRERDADGVFDGVEDGWGRAVHREFADALRARGAAKVRVLEEVHAYRGDVGGGRDDVVGHLSVRHAPALPHDRFVERPADALRDAALDLPGGEYGMNHAAHLLHGDEVFDARFIRHRVNAHLGDVDGPSVSAVRVAAVALVVPLYVFGLPVLREDFERAVLFNVVAARAREVVRRERLDE